MKINHDKHVRELGYCPWCDMRLDAPCDKPVRLSYTGMFMYPSIEEQNDLRTLDAINGGMPGWWPYERQREGQK